jgi:hypothetical protein
MHTQAYEKIAPQAPAPVLRLFAPGILFLAVGTLALVSQDALAGAAKWSSTNIQYLYGDTYSAIGVDGAGKLMSTDVSSSVITLEHVNGWEIWR